jgi:hypothetical protein
MLLGLPQKLFVENEQSKGWAIYWDWIGGFQIGFDVLWDAKTLCISFGIITLLYIWDVEAYKATAQASINELES